LWISTGFNADPNPAFYVNAVPDPDRALMTKFSKLLQAEKNLFIFISKIAIYLSLGPHEGRASLMRSLYLSKENIRHLKT